MSNEASTRVPEQDPHSSRLALLLAAAMFVLVVDTSLMNVSISSAVSYTHLRAHETRHDLV